MGYCGGGALLILINIISDLQISGIYLIGFPVGEGFRAFIFLINMIYPAVIAMFWRHRYFNPTAILRVNNY